MRRRPDDKSARRQTSESRAEDALSRFLQNNPRFFVYLGIGLGALALIALVIAKLS